MSKPNQTPDFIWAHCCACNRLAGQLHILFLSYSSFFVLSSSVLSPETKSVARRRSLRLVTRSFEPSSLCHRSLLSLFTRIRWWIRLFVCSLLPASVPVYQAPESHQHLPSPVHVDLTRNKKIPEKHQLTQPTQVPKVPKGPAVIFCANQPTRNERRDPTGTTGQARGKSSAPVDRYPTASAVGSHSTPALS